MHRRDFLRSSLGLTLSGCTALEKPKETVALRIPPDKTIVINRIPFDFILVKPGQFDCVLNAREYLRGSAEPLFKTITLTQPFYLAQTLLTFDQHRVLFGSTPEWSNILFPDDWLKPFPIADYAETLLKSFNNQTGLTAQLPTEAQWEYACRAGSKTRYYNGDASGHLGEIAWFKENCRSAQPVAQKRPNAWGFYDMLGNMPELCADYWIEAPGAVDPIGSTGVGYPEVKGARGGHFSSSAIECSSFYRGASGSGFGPRLQCGLRFALSIG